MTEAVIGDVLVTFTAEGEQALDTLAQILVDSANRTPEGIADLFERLATAPIGVLAEALTSVADRLREDRLVRDPAGFSVVRPRVG